MQTGRSRSGAALSPVRRLVGLVPAGLLLVLLLVGCGSITPPRFLGGAGASSRPVTDLAVDGEGGLVKASGGLYRSTDGGQRWRPLPVPSALRPDGLRRVLSTPAAPSNLYAAGPGAGVVRSDDGGQTWRAIGGGLPSQDVGALAVHAARPDTLYAWIDGQGVFRTEDGGGRWQKMDDGPPARLAGLVHSPLEGSMNTGWLYAATPEGPYLSMDCF